MKTHSIEILPTTNGIMNITGEKYQAGGFYSYTKGLHTVAVYLNNFVGRLYIEGSLATDPTDKDWFPISLEDGLPYKEFKKETTPNPNNIWVKSFNINLVWIRARIDRDYLIPRPKNASDVGCIKKILLNY